MLSPRMNRMLGFCCCWADAGATIAQASDASRASRMFQRLFIVDLPTKWLLDRLMVRGRPVGRPHHPQASELLARVPLTLLELFHDLIQVVARRILKGGGTPCRIPAPSATAPARSAAGSSRRCKP